MNVPGGENLSPVPAEQAGIPPLSLSTGNLDFCPDPERALRNIEHFVAENPDRAKLVAHHLRETALLFSFSQHLAHYVTRYPAALDRAISLSTEPLTPEDLCAQLRALLEASASLQEGMRACRLFKKDTLLRITLRDLLQTVDFTQVMRDLSDLADAILQESLVFVESFIARRYGQPEDNSFCILAMGKLGAQELNYSSDIDIMFLYREEGQTPGAEGPQGTVMNRVSAFEYYTKLAEELSRFLSVNTEDGFVYRVDLRLRPQGQKGSLTLPLRGYEEYYESWGQLWERAALMRARPAAGDLLLGERLLQSLSPFVYRKYLDFDAINEIRRMKNQVETIRSGTMSTDLKRGLGGIREIEFFIQIFQLIHGGREPLIRGRSTLRSLHRLLQKGLIGHEDMRLLSDDYLFLRMIEHRLQQLNDLQTHTIPRGERDLAILARKMGFTTREQFTAELDRRRRRVRGIYDSLLYAPDRSGAAAPGGQPRFNFLDYSYWDMDSPVEHVLVSELRTSGVRDPARAVHHLMKIRNTLYSFQTIRGRRLLEEVMPRFVNAALQGDNPDLALLQLTDFAALLSTKESYLEALSQREEFIMGLSFVFSHSEYLSRILMSNILYLESLVEDTLRKKRIREAREELGTLTDRYGTNNAIRLFRRLKEVRIGLLFINRIITAAELMKSLSRTADIIVGSLASPLAPLCIVAFGKLGGREIIFNSDLDLVFFTPSETREADIRNAERFIRICASYTKEGVVYSIDTRLRPEGSKGPLVNSLEGMRKYYMLSAKPWELQALLKARPICAASHAGAEFMQLRREVLIRRGPEVSVQEIQSMREKIRRELSREAATGKNASSLPQPTGPYDIKLGTGGLGDLEFAVQYLQLQHCSAHPSLLVQNTLAAIRRLYNTGVLDAETSSLFTDHYVLYRNIEVMLRLRNETVLKAESEVHQGIARIMGMEDDALIDALHRAREWIRSFWDRLS